VKGHNLSIARVDIWTTLLAKVRGLPYGEKIETRKGIFKLMKKSMKNIVSLVGASALLVLAGCATDTTDTEAEVERL
jgi:hypothetical protein